MLYVKSVAADGYKNTDADKFAQSETFSYAEGGAGTLKTYTVDFESATTAYTDWTFSTFTTKQSGTAVTAHGGSYYGTTAGKASGYLLFKRQLASPQSITFYVTKQTNNTTSSNWIIQQSTDNKTWSNIKSESATSMSKGGLERNYG